MKLKTRAGSSIDFYSNSSSVHFSKSEFKFEFENSIFQLQVKIRVR